MKTSWIVLFVVALFTLSACGGGSGGTKTGGPDEITSGNGLEMSFSLNEGDLASLKQVEYEIRLENSGKYPVTLRRNQGEFVLDTVQSETGSGSAFEVGSLEDFYDNVFEGREEIVLLNGASLSKKGVLFLEESFFDNLNNERVTYTLRTSYDYKTDFNNNIELDLDDKELRSDRVSQAAPVKLTDISLEQLTRDEFYVYYTLQDQGRGFFQESGVEIQDVEFLFGDQSFSVGNCIVLRQSEGQLRPTDSQEIIFTDDVKEFILSCPVDLFRFGDSGTTNTKTSGSFEYEYRLGIEGEFSLPEGRSIDFR